MSFGIYATATRTKMTVSGWVPAPNDVVKRFEGRHVTFATRELAQAWLDAAFTHTGCDYEVKEYV